MEDKDGNRAKKIGITKYKDRRLRFRSSYLYKELFNHDDICDLTRAEARGVEKRLLLDTRKWIYNGDFSAEYDKKEKFDGKTELRKLELDDQLIESKIKIYLSEVKNKGWLNFWLENNPGKHEKIYLKNNPPSYAPSINAL